MFLSLHQISNQCDDPEMGWVKDIKEILAPLAIVASLAIVEMEEGQDGNKGPV